MGSTLSVHRGFPRPSRSADGETDVILFTPASALFNTEGAPRDMPDNLAATFFHRSPVTSALLVAAAEIYLHLLRQQREWPPLGPLRDRLGWLVCGYSPRLSSWLGPATRTLPASSVAIVGVRLED